MRLISQGTYFARYALEDVEFVALSDGYVDMPASRLRQAGDLPFGRALPEQIPLADGQLRLSVNAFLITIDGQSTLIDTGASDAWLPTMGRLFEALDEAGIKREAIRTVALTHTHEDHVNGLVAPDGSDAFPNLAELYVPQDEIEHLRQYPRLDRFYDVCTPVEHSTEIVDRITAVAAHGHEIGHTAYSVSSRDGQILVWGDVVHVPSIQFLQPDLTWELDNDQDVARNTRHSMFKMACNSETYVAGAHLDFPGVGKVMENGNAYKFQSI